jgi:hypothetical protein
MKHRTRTVACLVGAALALAVGACSPAALEYAPPTAGAESPAGTSSALAAPGAPQPSAGTALAGLAELPVKGRAPRTGYDRDKFGPAWADTDRNGCDTRNDILALDLQAETFKPGTRGCVVQTGLLRDPYTAVEISFSKGGQALVDIDHVVALGNAWETGAQRLSPEDRLLLANDPLNLLAVDGPANRQKGDSDAATWLPSNRSFRCTYVALQTAVKLKYDLWVTAAERDAIAKVLAACPDQVLPGGEGTVAGFRPAPVPREAQGEVPESAPGAGGSATEAAAPPAGSAVSYATCADVEAAGAAPIKAGEPGWDEKFDGDGDGVGCQS